MIMNNYVEIPATYDKKMLADEVRKVRQPFLDQQIFADFMNGTAAYACNTPRQAFILMSMIRYTNICVFNANYCEDKEYTDVIAENIAGTEIGYYLDSDTTGKTLIFYTVPMDMPGHYTVDSEFIRSVSEIVGPSKLSSIRRLEYTIIDGLSSGYSSRIPWICYGGKLTVVGAKDIHAFVPRDKKEIDNIPHPDFDNFSENQPIIIAEFKDRLWIAAEYASSLISAHREYMNQLKQINNHLISWVSTTLSLERAMVDNPRLIPQSQSILAWLNNPRYNRVIIHLSTRKAIDELVELAAMMNIVYTGTLPNFNSGYIFIDNEGMIQISNDSLTGYLEIGTCDEAVHTIYHLVRDYVIRPGGVNMLAACKYPFINNVPAILWNGRQYDE